MRRTWFVVAMLGASFGACKQDLDDAVVPLDDLPASYASAVCDNLADCCDDGFDAEDCKLAGESSARAALDELVTMPGAIYHSDRAVECLQTTEASASRCGASFAVDCPDVFENARPLTDAGTPDIGAQCEGKLFQ